MDESDSREFVIAAIRTGNHALAAQRCAQWARNQGDDAEVWQMAAELYHKAGKYASASECYARAAIRYARQGKADSAVDMVRRHAAYRRGGEHASDLCCQLFSACRDPGIPAPLCEGVPLCRLFHRHPFWSDFSYAICEDFLRRGTLLRLAAQRRLARKGEAAKHVYVVVEGALQPSIPLPDGGVRDCASLVKWGGICGSIPFHIETGRHVYDIHTTEDSLLLLLPFPLLRGWMQRDDLCRARMRSLFQWHLHTYILANISFFTRLRVEDMESVARELQEMRVAAGETIFQQDACEGLGMYILQSGWVNIEYRWQEREHHLCTMRSGDVFGELGILRGKRQITARSATECRLLHWPETEYRRAYDRFYSIRDHAKASFSRYHRNMQMIREHSRDPMVPLSLTRHDELLQGMFYTGDEDCLDHSDL